MVDYEINGDNVTNFKMVVADWGSAYVGGYGDYYGGEFHGGTRVYAGPWSFDRFNKDLFSFGRLAMELFMDKTGTEVRLPFFGGQYISNLS